MLTATQKEIAFICGAFTFRDVADCTPRPQQTLLTDIKKKKWGLNIQLFIFKNQVKLK